MTERAGRRGWAAAWPLVISLSLPLALLAPLFDPRRVLAARDVLTFHLPLRTTWRWLLLDQGVWPTWNPLIHGGQPLLSNPNYAAFYPPSWLALALPVSWALGLLALLHAAWGSWGSLAAGAALGVRAGARLRSRRSASGPAASSSRLPARSISCSRPRGSPGWSSRRAPPWTPRVGAGCCRPRPRAAPWRCSCSPASRWRYSSPPLALRIGGGTAAAAAPDSRPAGGDGSAGDVLAGIQLLPTRERVAQTERAEGVALEMAGTWSMPPVRLDELFLPRSVRRSDRGCPRRYFGWAIHDQRYPYVIALYPGLLVSVLGLAGLLRRGIAHRGALGLTAAVGRCSRWVATSRCSHCSTACPVSPRPAIRRSSWSSPSLPRARRRARVAAC